MGTNEFRTTNSISCSKNYLKIALRNFRSNKIFSAINIFGLAISISASLVIFLIIQYDFSFDKFESSRKSCTEFEKRVMLKCAHESNRIELRFAIYNGNV